MNMHDDDHEDFHAAREGYSHLSDIEWEALGRMCCALGESAVGAMLQTLGVHQQHAVIAKFVANELAREREKVTLLHQQGSQQVDLLREQGAQQTELLRQQQFNAAANGPAQSRRPEALKIEISKYRGIEEDSLPRWFVELDDAIRARRLVDDEMQVAFAQSNLAGRAKAWALGLKLSDPYVFGSLEALKARLRQTFEPPRAEFRARAELFQIKQGKRDVHAYAQHVRHLASCVSAHPCHEHSLVTIFLLGLADGPVRTHLFRLELETLDEAIQVAEQEDFSLRQAQTSHQPYRPMRRQVAGGPEPMDLCSAESETSRSQAKKRPQLCYRCGKAGHYFYECSVTPEYPRTAVRGSRPDTKKGPRRGSTVVAKTQQRGGPSKNGRDQ